METVHIDLAGPCEASVGGSHYLVMFVDGASRWMQPHGMRNKSETTAYVQFLADAQINFVWVGVGFALLHKGDDGVWRARDEIFKHDESVFRF